MSASEAQRAEAVIYVATGVSRTAAAVRADRCRRAHEMAAAGASKEEIAEAIGVVRKYVDQLLRTDPSTRTGHGGGGQERRQSTEAAWARLLTERIEPSDEPRPRTRGECWAGPRPCPWVGCRYHLWLDEIGGKEVATYHDCDPWDLRETCALDVAERGRHTLEEVGVVMGVTRERVRQLLDRALSRFRAAMCRAERPGALREALRRAARAEGESGATGHGETPQEGVLARCGRN